MIWYCVFEFLLHIIHTNNLFNLPLIRVDNFTAYQCYLFYADIFN